MRKKICDCCGQEFTYRGRHGTRNKHFFCCYDCYIGFKTKKIETICEWCGRKFMKKRSDIKRTKHNFCSDGCCRDYITFCREDVENKKVAGQMIYRYIAEKKIGRPLASDEEVHHIDGNHRNNSPENLMVVTTSEHAKIHAAEKGRDRYGRFVKTE